MRDSEKGSQAADGDWDSLWKIRAPPKAKHLLWRICRDCLPTRCRLRQHYVPCPAMCQLCEGGVEDWHVFFGCSTSMRRWTAEGLWSIVAPRLQNFAEMKTLIHEICSKQDKEVAGRFAVMAWMIWNNRNNWIWNNEKSEATQLGKQAFKVWSDWFTAQNTQPNNASPNHNQQQLIWQPPREGWLKCNVDAGFHCQRGTTNRGWCFRDGIGRFVHAGSAWDVGRYFILEAEALALQEAIQAAIQMNMEHIIFESHPNEYGTHHI